MIAFVVILGMVLSAIIFVVNAQTAPRIAKNEELTIKRTVLEALVIAYRESGLEEVFSQNVTVVKKGEKTFYVSKSGDVAFEFTGSWL